VAGGSWQAEADVADSSASTNLTTADGLDLQPPKRMSSGRARAAPYVAAVLPFVAIPVLALICGQIAAAASCWVTADRRLPTEPPARRLALVSTAAAAGLVLLAVIALVDGMGATAANCSDLDEDMLRQDARSVAGCAGVAAVLAFILAGRSTSWRRGQSWLLGAELVPAGFAALFIAGHVLIATCGW
jgi:hypothetical protein